MDVILSDYKPPAMGLTRHMTPAANSVTEYAIAENRFRNTQMSRLDTPLLRTPDITVRASVEGNLNKISKYQLSQMLSNHQMSNEPRSIKKLSQQDDTNENYSSIEFDNDDGEDGSEQRDELIQENINIIDEKGIYNTPQKKDCFMRQHSKESKVSKGTKKSMK